MSITVTNSKVLLNLLALIQNVWQTREVNYGGDSVKHFVKVKF